MKFHRTVVDGVRTREYVLHTGMILRVDQKRGKYEDCSISENFRDFQFFSGWCKSQIGWNEDDWHLDKDLLIDGNTEYHEDKCVFVPRVINIAFVQENKPRTNNLPLGVVYDKKWDHYRAHCGVNGIQEYLGCYNNPEDAHKAYVIRKNEYVWQLAEEYKGRIREEIYYKLKNFSAK